MGANVDRDADDNRLPISAELRALLLDWQRQDIARVNSTRRLLGLPPVRVPDGRERPKGGRPNT